MNKKLKLQRSESFYIRDGWIEKVFLAYRDKSIGTFSVKTGTQILGIGSNMVKSLRYWVEACRLVDSFSKDSFQLSEKGRLLYENDPYMETIFSWELLHYWLVTNENHAPVFYALFNNDSIRQIRRKETAERLASAYCDSGYDNPNVGSIQKDVATFISSYAYDEESEGIPEQNISCPLSKLRLLTKTKVDGDFYEKTPIPYSFIDYRLFYICLRERYKEKFFNIDDALIEEMSPVLCFNLDRVTFLSLLSEMKKHDLIELNRTAGLNVVYLKSEKNDDMFFKEYLSENMGIGVL